MVMINYKELSPIIFGKYRIQKGQNEINDDDFYELMKSKYFAERVKQNIFQVPRDFPLEKPKEEPLKEDKKDQDYQACVHESNLKVTLNLIDESEDHEYLNHLMEHDVRDKVKESAKKKLKSLKHNK